jgi:hypothetical protein
VVPHADSSDRLTGRLATTRDAVERDVRLLRARADTARARVLAALNGIADVRQVLSGMIRRRDRNGDSSP